MYYPQPTTLAAHERGGETELRFFEAVQCQLWRKPFWLLGIRHATRVEDQNGVDAIARLDVGDVEVQIKTSHAGRIAHEQRYGNAHVTLVICSLMSPNEIRSRFSNLLYHRRGVIHQQRKGKTKARR